MQIPSGDLVPRRSGGWSGYRRRRAARRRRAVALLVAVLLVGGGAYVAVRMSGSPPDQVAACRALTDRLARTPAAGPVAELGPPPAAFRVRVLNATPRAGLAAEVAAGLVARGFRISGTGNAPPPAGRPVEPTHVRYAGRSTGAARVLADSVGPRVPVRQDERVRGEVQLVLGGDYRRLATTQEVAARAAARAAVPAGPSVVC